MNERKAFGPIPSEDNKIIAQESIRILRELILKFGDKNDQALDFVMNILCGALVNLAIRYVPPDDYPYIVQIMHKIITENTRNFQKALQEKLNE